MCAPLRRREPRTYAMVAHCARDGGARPPQLARGPSRGADGAPDDVRLWPLPRASQTDEEAGADEPRNELQHQGKKQKKQGKMLGDQWADAHGNAFQKFLAENLKKCECEQDWSAATPDRSDVRGRAAEPGNRRRLSSTCSYQCLASRRLPISHSAHPLAAVSPSGPAACESPHTHEPPRREPFYGEQSPHSARCVTM